MKDTFLDFQILISYSSKKSPMFHSYWGLCRVFVEPALAWNLLLQYISWGIWDIFVTCNPFLSRKVFAMQPALHQKSHNFTSPPKQNWDLSMLSYIYLYHLIPNYIPKKTNTMRKKEKNKTAPKKSEQNSCDRPVTPLILPPGVILSTVSLGGPTNWLIFCWRGISCFEIVSLCRNYPCWWRFFANNYQDVLTFALNNNIQF